MERRLLGSLALDVRGVDDGLAILDFGFEQSTSCPKIR